MKYYFDPIVGVRAFESDGSQDFLITDNMRPLTDEELEAHLNPSPTAEQLADKARLWRDAELTRADIELNKVQDGMGIGTVTQWRSYRVALRNWPTTDGWPDSTKPVAPDYKE